VLNTRTQQRSAAFGGAAGGRGMELRFMSGNADVQAGDTLVTSGLDGVYPPGLPVARVASVERRVEPALPASCWQAGGAGRRRAPRAGARAAGGAAAAAARARAERPARQGAGAPGRPP
jgi:rod shape-determining protein MreC